MVVATGRKADMVLFCSGMAVTDLQNYEGVRARECENVMASKIGTVCERAGACG